MYSILEKMSPMQLHEPRWRSLKIRLLIFVGRAGKATHSQFFRYAYLECKIDGITDEDLIIRTILDLLNSEELCEVRLELEDDETSEQLIFYLSKIGFDTVCEYNTRFARELTYGIPTDRQIATIPHDLLLAESLIFWIDDFDVIIFKSESQLFSDRKKDWHKGKRDNNSLPDFEIGMYHRSEGTFRVDKIEASIKYGTKRIKNKGKGLLWFTTTEYQAIRIHNLTGSQTIIKTPLKVIPNPNFDRIIRETLLTSINGRKYHLTSIEFRIFKLLKKTKMALSARNLMLFIPAGRNLLNRCVEELINADLVMYTNAKVIGDRVDEDFKPYVYLPEHEFIAENSIFRQQVVINEVLHLAIKAGWSYEKFSLAELALTVTKTGKIKELKEIFICDFFDVNEPESIEAIYEKYWELANKYTPSTVKIIITEKHRTDLLAKYLSKYNLFNLTDYSIQ